MPDREILPVRARPISEEQRLIATTYLQTLKFRESVSIVVMHNNSRWRTELKTAAGLLGLLAFSPLAAAEELPPKLQCISLGSWGCAEGGICIDSTRGKGERYYFNFEKMRFKSPSGHGTLSSLVASKSGKAAFMLSDGRRYVHAIRSEGRETVSYLYLSAASMLELMCKPH